MGLRQFRKTVDRRKRCQLSSVTSLSLERSPLLAARLPNCRDAARHAGLSATADYGRPM